MLRNDPVNSKLRTQLYFLELIGNDEHFYKIGYTTRDINYRYREGLPYRFNTTLLEDAKIKELDFIIKFNEYLYEPEIKFPGHTECFKKEIYNKMFKEI